MHANECARCGAQVSASAAACDYCGAAVDVGSRAVAPAPGTPLRCPKCASENVRRLAVVYQDGISTASVPVAVDRDGDGRIDATPGSELVTTRTQASVAATPPAKKPAWMVAGCVLPVMVLLGGMIGILVASVVGLVAGPAIAGWLVWRWYAKWRRYNADEYPGLMEAWQHTFRCDRCGTHFRAEI